MERIQRLIAIISLLLVLVSGQLIEALTVFAAPTATVTITATPEYLAMTNDSGNWTIGAVAEATTKHFTADGLVTAEPLADGDMKGTITNTGSVTSDVNIKCADFVNGVGWNIREADNVPGADEVAIRAGITGMANRAAMIQVKNTDMELIDSIVAAGTKMWCLELLTGTFGDGVAKSGTLTLTIVKHV